MNSQKPGAIYRSDYKEYQFSITSLHLNFDIFDSETLVSATTLFHRKDKLPAATPLQLMGEDLDLVSIAIDGRILQGGDYQLDDKSLVVVDVPDSFSLEIVTRIYPDKNRSLEGLYQSSGIYCTQCEAEGFRKITYFPDRPDVLTRYTTKISANKTSCPVLLSNGNLIEKGDLTDNRHFAVWQDPFPKPSYLFALVAGSLVVVKDKFTTKSGRIVDLRIYVEERNKTKCDHAMQSLKKSMRWDEDTFGLEYDLGIFMIVAVDDFNMGAMENKGLNIFNSKYVLSSPETATDTDYLGIEGVIGHEYFHNWTGNRVTCRDWFQLSLKEGLTVFRDQEFSSDMNSRPVKRIDDVRILRNFQFKEDGSPMAHPVRPDSYVEINNFYTATVYNKGAEVIRMMHTILGAKRFRKGIDLYFERHDGQAVTCDDFVAAMSDASNEDLQQFKNWYSQAGTPLLQIKEKWDEKEQVYTLHIKQTCPDTPGQEDKQPFHMPIKLGLIGPDGSSFGDNSDEGKILQLTDGEQSFSFSDIPVKPVVSFLRDFSAPVRVEPFQNPCDLATLIKYDSNHYNRWEAINRLATDTILVVAEAIKNGEKIETNPLFHEAYSYNLSHNDYDPSLLSLSLALPAETTIAQEMAVIDPSGLHSARQRVRYEIALNNREIFKGLVEGAVEEKSYKLTPDAMGKRGLKNVALSYLMSLSQTDEEIVQFCLEQYYKSTNMTDTIGALSNIVNLQRPEKEAVLADFYQKWQADPLVLDKWFALQANSTLPDTLAMVKKLMTNESFSIENPNKVRSLIGVFCAGNHVRFHSKSGEGYTFLGDRILELNKINPQIAARLVGPLISWRRYDDGRQQLMKKELERIVATPGLSRDVYEIVSKSLG